MINRIKSRQTHSLIPVFLYPIPARQFSEGRNEVPLGDYPGRVHIEAGILQALYHPCVTGIENVVIPFGFEKIPGIFVYPAFDWISSRISLKTI